MSKAIASQRTPKTGGVRRAFFRLIVFFVLLLAYMWLVEPYWVEIERSTVPIAGLPASFAGTRAVFVADVHLGGAHGNGLGEKDIKRLCDTIQKEKPDVLLLGGDLGDEIELIEKLLAALEKIPTPLGKIAVLGNHEYMVSGLLQDSKVPGWESWEKQRKSYKALYKKYGVTLLIDGTAKVEHEDGALTFLGIDFYSKKAEREAVLAKLPKSGPILALMHTPEQSGILPARTALSLSGHTHGGQVTLFGIAPMRRTFRTEFFSGWYDRGEGRQLTSRGYGTTAYPLRLMCRPQLHVLTLEGKK